MIPTGMSKEQEEAYLCKWTLFICKFSFPSFRPEDFRLVYTFSYQVCVSPMIIYQIAAFLTFGQYAHNPFFTVQLKIEEASRRLRSGDLGIALNPEDRFDQLLLLSTFWDDGRMMGLSIQTFITIIWVRLQTGSFKCSVNQIQRNTNPCSHGRIRTLPLINDYLCRNDSIFWISWH